MSKTIVPIKGMHCKSCEILIEDELKKVKGITSVSADHNKSRVEITTNGTLPDGNEIETAVNRAGYQVGKSESSIVSKNIGDYIELGLSVLILALVYFVVSELGLFNFSQVGNGNLSSLGAVILIGLTAGFSTCMALVGGLVLGASAQFSASHPNATSLQKFKPHVFFNVGRVIAFFFLGGLIGAAGSFLQLSGPVLGVLTIGVGLVMLLLGIQLINIFPRLEGKALTLPKNISRALGIKSGNKEYSHKNAMITGALTFFLPCGFTQAMQLYAISTGSFMSGALTMGIFAIGTMPGLLGIGGITSLIKGSFSKTFFRFAGLIVIALAIFNISNGYNLLGINLLPSVKGGAVAAENNDPNVTLENGTQVVKMAQVAGGYSPNHFTIKKGIPVKWIIDGQAPNSCSRSLMVSALGITKNLNVGENVIEFVPQNAGTIKFSCSMGMYTGSFTVVDSNSTNSQDTTPLAQQASNAQPATGCGGSSGCGGSLSGTATGGCGCGGAKNQALTEGIAAQDGNVQVIQTTYTAAKDISPNSFTVKTGEKVRMEIYAQDAGAGCMGSITVPGLTGDVKSLTKGQTIILDFTPQKTGKFNITCAMGMVRGSITVI